MHILFFLKRFNNQLENNKGRRYFKLKANILIQNSTNHLLAQAMSKKINSELSKFDQITGPNLLIF